MASPHITVFTARQIVTIDPSLPEATAIAVRDGRVVEVGSIESLDPWLRNHAHEIDNRFSDSVILPGLIDPHIHPGLMALLLAAEWVPPEPWDLPSGHVEAAEGRDQFLERVRELHEARTDPHDPLVVFGYHAQYHGHVERGDLDAISNGRPIVLWQRSFHELRCNGAALDWLNATPFRTYLMPQIPAVKNVGRKTRSSIWRSSPLSQPIESRSVVAPSSSPTERS